MAGPTARCAWERMREALRASISRRTGSLLNRLSIVCGSDRIVIETSSRSYYAIQLILSAVAAADGGRKLPIDLAARVNGRALSLRLPPTNPSSANGEVLPAPRDGRRRTPAGSDL